MNGRLIVLFLVSILIKAYLINAAHSTMVVHPPRVDDDLRARGGLSPQPAGTTSAETVLKYVALQKPTPWSSAGSYTDPSPVITRLFLKPDYKEWKRVLADLKITFASDPTALDIVYLLNDLKGEAISLDAAGALDHPTAQTIEHLASQALLQLFSGCWGFSTGPVAPDVIGRLRGIAQGVGQSSSRLGVSENNFSQSVVGTFTSSPHFPTPAWQDHYWAVLVCLAEGFTAGDPSRAYEVLQLQLALLWSGSTDMSGVGAFLSIAGYYPDGQPVTVADLCGTARYRNPSLPISAAQQASLATYLDRLDLDSPGITAHLEDFR